MAKGSRLKAGDGFAKRGERRGARLSGGSGVGFGEAGFTRNGAKKIVGNLSGVTDQSLRCCEITYAVGKRIDAGRSHMAKADLRNMDVDALLGLRADVEKALAERGRDLQRQLALLGGEVGKGRGRPAGGPGRVSAMRGKSIPPKYRGPGGETWAGRGATPRWLAALLKEGHSIEEFLIGAGRRKAAAVAVKKRVAKKKAARPVRKARRPKESKTKAEPAAA